MKALLLAGGYARRLWPLTKDMPKVLLKVGGKPVINYIAEDLEHLECIDKVLVSTNKRFEDSFRKWLQENDFGKVKLIVEDTETEKEKLGSVGGMDYVIRTEKIDDDMIVIAADNIYGFDTKELIDFQRKVGSPVFAAFDIGDTESAKKYGILTCEGSRLITFEEKPEHPKSTLASTGCYIFPRNVVRMVTQYVDAGNNTDEPGHFIKWLSKRTDIQVFAFDNYWFDIGDKKSLRKADEFMKGR